MTKHGETAARLIRLVEKGAVSSQTCAAGALGVTKQRVNQIVLKEGLKLGLSPQRNTLIEWPCPSCGATVKMWTRLRQRRRTAYCKNCSKTGRPGRVTIICGACGRERETFRSQEKHRKSSLCRPCWLASPLNTGRPREAAQ